MKKAILITIILISNLLIGQEQKIDKIITSFDDYSSLYREVAYCHLNKSTFIKGEMIGFSGYVLDKDSKVPSESTKNLYCVITDASNKVVKSKLVKVDNGFTNNVFTVDSLFSSGHYTFKAYTNWMRNFDEPNAFVESFRVIDPEEESSIEKTATIQKLDAQFLPEGGFFVNSVKTSVGVIIKNNQGYGVQDVEGKVYDSNDQLLISFQTNAFGIGKFQFTPSLDQTYKVEVNHLGKIYNYEIDDIKPKGISVHVNNSPKLLAVELRTNQSTLRDIKGKSYKLTVHNGKTAKATPVTFKEKSLLKIVNHEELFSGINILTLFDENNKPVLERIFFHYTGINFINPGTPITTTYKDSTRIRIPLSNLAHSSTDKTNISVSILPETTKSYQRQHNIISYTYLQPYLKSYVENAHYYFTNVDAKKKYDLDNLLLTQGWSSYNWDDIFNNNVTDTYAFEDGIVLKANQNKKRQKEYVVYPLEQNNGVKVSLSEDQDSFVVSSLYPIESEMLGIGTMNKKGKVWKPDLGTEFYPSEIPDFENTFKVLQTNQSFSPKGISKSEFSLIDLNKTQKLDEVFIKAKKRQTKIENLKKDIFTKVYAFDDTKRNSNLTFANYVNAYLPDYYARETSGSFEIVPRVARSNVNDPSPLIYLDDQLIVNQNYFYAYNMNIVDYLVVNENGYGEGFLGAGGVIKIYTSLDFVNKNKRGPFRQFEFPLTFAKNKNFYVPKYNVYKGDFFKDYGVIDWIPNCKIDDDGSLNFTVHNPANSPLKFFIEGITNTGDLVSEVVVVNNDVYN
jgi:hypothetical protein